LTASLLSCLLVLFVASPALAQAARGGGLAGAQILGPETLSKQITVTFWLKQQNKAAFDELVRQMYDKSSPNYHHWLTLQQYKEKFAPRAADLAVVRQHLANNHLAVVATDKLNHYVVARGSVADVQRAAGVQLNRVSLNGEVHRLPAAIPAVPGAAGAVVNAVQVSDLRYENHTARAIDPDSGKPVPPVPLSVGNNGLFFTGNCFRPPQTKTFKTPGGGPRAVYSGNRYGSNINSGPPNLPYCGYDANEIQKAYGLKSLYKSHLDGTGQTVAIIDAYGSDTIQADANAFSQLNNLPQLSSSNFQISMPTGPTSCNSDCVNGSWNVETSLDVEWAHAVAPGANIALVLAADNSFTNLDLSILYAIETGLAPVVSNSWGIGEIVLETYLPSELVVENTLNELGASLGVSVNFSTGDNGDFSYRLGVTTVSMPASSPYATGVGGTSLFLNPDKSIKLQTGWGNNETRVASYSPNPPVIPPLQLGFIYGGGGGTSEVWAKPDYQSGLTGSGRMLPDVSYVGDPYTGVEFIYTDPSSGQQLVGVVGGTSLSCPMFSGLWAIVAQAAGTWPGQAAPYMYSLPAEATTDVQAVSSSDNVAGVIYNPPNPPTYESPDDLAAPLGNTTNYVSALFNGLSTRWYVLTFGTDTSLTTGPGWDNVTGVGTPNGAAFVQGVVGAAK